ncbi:MAG: glycoside hydrolase family 3 C-terminal domain-containing protein [Cyclobacteriaceae bacterium]
MKKFFKILLYIIGALILILALTYAGFSIKWNSQSKANYAKLGEEAPTLTIEGRQLRDLNKNGSLDIYENPDLSIDDRVEDLIKQMTVEEKAGMMFITMAILEDDGSIIDKPTLSNPFSFMLESITSMMLNKNMNHFNILSAGSADGLLKWHNDIQKMAERSRLGIPVTIASDPRHGKPMNFGTNLAAQFFTRWPSQLGFGAIDDTVLVREFGDIARQEYNAVGIRVALHPMADLGTEPRWARINSVFSEDAYMTSRLTRAYIQGFQGDSLDANSVACMVKHFSGGGPQTDGWDAHFASGKGQSYDGGQFDYHMIPFVEGAFPANAAQIMPYYGIPTGQTSEDVGFAYNKEIITDLLRDSLGFEGVVTTDWGLVTDMAVKEASAWGVEHLTEKERVAKIINAGCDQFGGETRAALVVELVKEGKISEERINASIRRLLRDKFRLGLFDNPYLDPTGLAIFNNEVNREKGRAAQRRSLVLLKNEGLLPLAKDKKVYLSGWESEKYVDFPQIVSSVEDADVVLLKLPIPKSPSPGGGLMEGLFPQGRLDFPQEEKEEYLNLISQKPAITIMTIGRPAVIPDINAASKAVIADFEVEEDIILEMIFGEFSPSGKLPLEIPSSMEAVEAQLEDMPYDSKDPLYQYGHGLSY